MRQHTRLDPARSSFIISTIRINMGRSECLSNDVGAFRSANFVQIYLYCCSDSNGLGALGVIVAAQSLCLISVSISFMAALVLRLSDRISAAGLATKSLVIIFLSLLAIAGVGVDIGALKSIVVAWQQVKAESITAHLSNFETQVDAHPLSFLGVAPTGVMGECGWLNLLLNQGILLTALYGVFYNRHCACGECSAELFYTGKRSVIWSFFVFR